MVILHGILIYDRECKKIACELPKTYTPNPHFAKIKQRLDAPNAKIINDQKSQCLFIDNQWYYLFSTDTKMIFLALNQELNRHESVVLYKKLKDAHLDPTSLANFIKMPQDIFKDRMDDLKISIVEVKEEAMKAIDKLIERGAKIEDLLMKTEKLATDSKGFQKRAHVLKNRYTCPTLFSLFSFVNDGISNWWNQNNGQEPVNKDEVQKRLGV